jgi:hypothetical protein
MSREFMEVFRRAILLLLDGLEKEMRKEPTTATIRKWYKQAHK